MISGAQTLPELDHGATCGSASLPCTQVTMSGLVSTCTFIPLPLVAMAR
ncbi:Uncharacterised protein [Mycobacteroides abscessus subsp. abscessus]|nr:Uncharacterised protein [Mycobacteroides abscessus subsp. abscessus]